MGKIRGSMVPGIVPKAAFLPNLFLRGRKRACGKKCGCAWG